MISAFHCSNLSCKSRNPFVSAHFASSPRSTLAAFRSISFSTSLSRNMCFKGCLSTIIVQRPIRQSVICMARRYAPNSRLRKVKSRKRGGDPEKKRKRKRKRTGKRKGRGETKKKRNVKVVRLVSSAGTGVFYAKKRNTKNKEKLEIKKYDPSTKRHVKFSEPLGIILDRAENEGVIDLPLNFFTADFKNLVIPATYYQRFQHFQVAQMSSDPAADGFIFGDTGALRGRRRRFRSML